MAAASAMGGVLLAERQFYAQLVVVSAVLFALVTLGARKRERFILIVLVLSTQRLFYKLLGPTDTDIAGGVAGLYVQTPDILLVVLACFWAASGTALTDLKQALMRPVVFIPLLCAMSVLPSFLAATAPYFSLAEFVRMAWMLALYVYVAARVRDRRDLLAVLGALLAITFIQTLLATAQWATQSSLGLVRVGDESQLVTRVADDAEIVRPSGTILHPVFLAAILAEIGLVALSVGLSTESKRWRLLCLLSAGAGLLGMVLSQTRVAFLTIIPVAGAVCVWAISRGYVRLRTVVGVVAMVGIVSVVANALVTHGNIAEGIARNFLSEHVGVEVEARQQVNEVGLSVARDAPLVGVGLDNYEQVLPRYDRYGIGLTGLPPHNLYILVLADTGVVGLAGMLLTFCALVVGAFRLARSRDRTLAGIGVGALAMYAFYALEETTSFTLRHDVPLLGFWLLAGLVAAGLRIAEREGPATMSTGAR